MASPAPSPRFDRAVARLLKTEGGFVDHKNDKGGTTNFGISLRFLIAEGKIDANRDGFADFDLDMDGDIDGADIRRLTRDHAIALYRRCFWDDIGCDQFPAPLGEILFDQAVNGGRKAAIRLLQQAVNFVVPGAVTADGSYGPRTDKAWRSVVANNRIGVSGLIDAYRDVTKARYRAIVAADPSQRVFLKGWLRRADELGR